MFMKRKRTRTDGLKRAGSHAAQARSVPRTGFEPVISALRGRCPRPLDDRGVPYFLLPGKDSNLQLFGPEPNDLPIDLPGKRCQSSKAADPPVPHYPMAR